MHASTTAAVQQARTLVDLAGVDPAYRDVYLQHARQLVRPIVPPAVYEAARHEEAQMERAKQALVQAVSQHRWYQVASLAAAIRGTEQRRAAAAPELALAREVYDPLDLPLGPLSLAAARLTPGGGAQFREARARALRLLDAAATDDEEWARRLVARRTALQRLPEPAETAARGIPDEHALETAARQALQQGRWEALERLAGSLHAVEAPETGGCDCEPGSPELSRRSDVLSGQVVEAGAALGLVRVHVDAAPMLHAYTSCRCASTPRLGSEDAARSGTPHQCACRDRCPDLEGALRENLDLLKHRLFVSSCGERYLPRFEAEDLLVESFREEDADVREPGPLLARLALGARMGLSRLEIESALNTRGPDAVASLGLDPWEYRLTCIPFDVYQRAAASFGWGRRPWWTHLDGYQVWRGWRLRALAGGHASYGGSDDLTGLGVGDARDNTVARLAVVRRARLLGPDSP